MVRVLAGIVPLGLILRSESSASLDGSTRGFQCLSSSLLYRMGAANKYSKGKTTR